MKLLIQNGRVVDPVNGTVSILDLYVEKWKVLQLEKDIQTEADRVIDATLVVCPGLVDLHVHLRDPGLTYKEDIFTGTPPPPGEESPPWLVWPIPTRWWTARSRSSISVRRPARPTGSMSTLWARSPGACGGRSSPTRTP